MNEGQRAALQRHCKQLATDLIMSEELLGDLYQTHIFDRNMLGMIRAQVTDSDKAYKMLELLPKRGPKAFDTFINIIQDNYPWLAASLESSAQTEKTRQPLHGSVGLGKPDRMYSVTETPRHVDKDDDIRKKVGTFVHKQFGQSKRISQNDKKAVLKFLNDQLIEQRARLQSEMQGSTPDTMESESLASETGDVQQRLFEIHVTLEPYLKLKDKLNRSCLPEDMTFGLVLQEINTLLLSLSDSEQLIKKCFSLPGLRIEAYDDDDEEDDDVDMSLDCCIEKLLKQLERELEKVFSKEEYITQLESNLADCSEKNQDLKEDQIHSRKKFDNLSKEMSKLRQDKYKLEERCYRLEKEHQQHIEKEKTIEDLKAMVRDLQTTKVNPSKTSTAGFRGENMSVRTSKDSPFFLNSMRMTTRTSTERLAAKATPKSIINYPMYRTRYTTGGTVGKRKANLLGGPKL